jgi:PAS domain S-box-containing protein
VSDESKSEAELLEENKRLRRRIFELEQAECTQGDLAVAEPEQILRTIVENAADGILVADAASKQFFVANRVICQMLGYSQEELQNLGVADIHAEQDMPYVMEQFQKLISGGSSLAKDVQVRRKDHSVFRADIHSSPITLAGKTYLMGIFRDVDERNQIRDRNETILRTCTDGFWLIDEDGHILEVNDAYCRMSGYRRDELLTMSVQDVEAAETVQETMDHIREIMARGTHRFESRQRRKDGTIIDLDISTHRLRSDAGKIFTFLRDITAQKQTERALRDSEARYRTLVEQLPAITYVAALDDASTTLYVSPQIEHFIGVTPEEYRGDPDIWRERLHPDDRERVLRAVIESHAEEKAFVQEYRMIGEDGRIVWFRDEGVIVKGENDQPLFFQGVMYDITEQKRAEEALRYSEERFRLAMETTNDALWDWNMVTDEVYRNPCHDTMLGYEPGELPPSQDDWDKRIHPDDRALVLGIMKGYLAGTRNSITMEYRLATKSGDYIWVLGRGKVVAYNDDGMPVRMIGTNIDITQRKKAEKELRDSKDLLDKTFRSLDSAIFILDCGTPPRIIDCNPAACSIFGYGRGEMLGQPVDFLHVNEESLLEFRKTLLCAVEKQGHLSSFEFRMKRKDGEIFPTEHAVFPLQNDDGDRIGWVSVVRDITERRRTLEAIRQNQTLIQGILDHANSVIVVRDVQGRYVMVNREAENVLGMASCEITGKTPYDIHTSDKARKILSDDKQVIESRKPFHIEDQLEVKGEVRTFLGARFPLLNPANEPYAVCTVAADITERKKAEDALRESEQRYRTLVESAGETIATIDINGVFTFMNATGAKRLGGTPNDFVGKTMWDLFPKEIADHQAASVRKAITTGQGLNVIVPTQLHGQLRWYSTTIEPLRDGTGEVSAAMIVARDIHELMQAQEKVRTLSSAVAQSMDGVAVGDVESRLLYVNDAFAHMHGCGPHEMIGMKAADLYAQDQMDKFEAIFARIRKDGSYAGQVWHVRKDGTEFPCYVSVTLVKNDQAEATGTVAVCRDMTEIRQKQEELNRYRTQMARAEQLASLGTLSATVAHQITQPLTVIRLSLDNALDEMEGTSCPKKAVRRLQDSVVQVSNIVDIINRFRNFARQSSDTRFGQVHVNVIAERVVRLLEESARQARVTLRLKGMGKLPSVTMNETDLEQLFFALLENAIQAADGARTRQVVISGAVKDERVELRFCDNCGGITPENRDRIFEPFFTTKPRGQGTGLGLCIVHDVVTRVGGHIRLESDLGRGTTFFVTLPVHKERAQ